jgi:HEPN domain-containing protein
MPDPEAILLAREWLDYARGDLAAARDAAEGTSFQPRHACMLAQQATEKAIKSLLVLEQIQHPLIHDVVRLRENVPTGFALQGADLDLAPLNRWIVEGRYPGELEASAADAHEAVELAGRIVELVEGDFEREASE